MSLPRRIGAVLLTALSLAIATGSAHGAGIRPATPAGGPVPAGFVGASLSFISSEYGWVLGTTRSCAHAPCTSLLRTTNGGRSWQGIPAPRTPLDQFGADADVAAVRFANADDGFAFDPGLWTTSDGGQHWSRTRTLGAMKQFLVLSLAATSNGAVYALAEAGSFSTGSTGPIRLFRAAPHSTRFSALRTIPEAEVPAAVIAAGARVYVQSGHTGLLSFGPGGERTTTVPAQLCELTASGTSALLAVCGGVANSNGVTGSRTVFGTTDGGGHWTRLPNPGAGDGYENAGVAETTDGHAVIVTGGDRAEGLLSSSDHGESWHTTLSYRNAHGAIFTDLGFENNLAGSVIYNPAASGLDRPSHPTGILLRTDDGGLSWHRVAY